MTLEATYVVPFHITFIDGPTWGCGLPDGDLPSQACIFAYARTSRRLSRRPGRDDSEGHPRDGFGTCRRLQFLLRRLEMLMSGRRRDAELLADHAIGGATQVQVSSTTDLGFIPTSWNVALTGDFNGDGKSDILWRNTNGDTSIWCMNGTTVFSTPDMGAVPTRWLIQAAGAE
jgi:hypothetical protein